MAKQASSRPRQFPTQKGTLLRGEARFKANDFNSSLCCLKSGPPLWRGLRRTLNTHARMTIGRTRGDAVGAQRSANRFDIVALSQKRDSKRRRNIASVSNGSSVNDIAWFSMALHHRGSGRSGCRVVPPADCGFAKRSGPTQPHSGHKSPSPKIHRTCVMEKLPRNP